MNISQYFELLRTQKWVLTVPERVYRAHQDGLLPKWGLLDSFWRDGSWDRIRNLLSSLATYQADLQIPLHLPTGEDGGKRMSWGAKAICEECSEHLRVVHVGVECPPMPKSTIAADELWDTLVNKYGVVRRDAHRAFSLTRRLMSWDGWVHRVHICPLWMEYGEPNPPWPFRLSDLTEEEWGTRRKEWDLECEKTRAKRRVLREKYGLTGDYFGSHQNYTRRPTLIVLEKAYPPEQVRHVRRQLEDNLRKDEAEVIRYALARQLVT